MFRAFDILLTPHSSQLANLVFTPPGRSIIEMQAWRAGPSKASKDGSWDRTFFRMSEQLQLHHQVIVSNEDNGVDAD
eukprot:SAG31_NODE_27939_length_418_cov_0.623824_1_plen_76_part_01